MVSGLGFRFYEGSTLGSELLYQAGLGFDLRYTVGFRVYIGLEGGVASVRVIEIRYVARRFARV